MQKLKEKTMKKNWTTHLACNPSLAHTLAKWESSGLAQRRPTSKPKGCRVKIKLP